MTVQAPQSKNQIHRRGSLYAATLLVAGLAGTLSCGGDGTTNPVSPPPPPPPPPPPVATSVTVSPATTELDAVGAIVQLSAEVLDQNGQPMSGAAVAWSSGDESVATVDAAGFATAVGNGQATITAASGSASGSATVTVAQVVATVAVSPASASLEVGDTLRLSAEATDANGHAVAGAEFSWSSGDESVATVDGAGLVTAVSEGEAAVTATSGPASGGAAVSVSPAPPVATSLTVGPSTAELDALGATAQLSAEVLDQNGRPMPGAAVTWSSGDPSVATVDESGLATAVGNGQATITATSGSASGSATVTVAQVAAAVALSPASASIEVGDTLRLSAVATDANGHAVAGAEFSWASGDESVATVDGAGLVTAVAEGEAAVTATSGGAPGSATVRVSPPPVPPEPVGTMPDQTLISGQTATVEASEYFGDPDGGDLSYAAASSDSAVATAEVFGSEVTVAGTGSGTATVTVTATDPDGLSAEQSFVVVVSDGVEEDFESSASLNDWEAANAEIAVTDGALAITNQTEGRLGLAKRREMPSLTEWTIQARMGRTTRRARPGVVSLTGHGRFTAVRLVLRTLDDEDRDRGRGRVADIGRTASSHNYEFAVFDGGAGEWVLLTNLSGNSESVSEEPGEFTDIEFGHEAGDFVGYAGESGAVDELFRVDLADARVDGVPLGEIVSDATGLWLANQGPVGSTALHDRVRVTGSESDATPPDEAEIEDAPDEATRSTTAAAPVASVTVTPATATVAVGDTLRLSAEAHDANGRVVAGAEFSWSSNNEAAATIDASGLVTGLAEGAATITATTGSVQGSSDITVARPGSSPDRAALVALYEATDGSNWVNSENWLTDAPLGTWYGVETDASGRVVTLDLSGVPNESWHGLSGQIPVELGSLAGLERLDLSWNGLSGAIPPELGNLASLKHLDLSNTQVSGPIPPEIGDLVNLEHLDLEFSNLSGPIPLELWGLTRLKVLDLRFDYVPIPPELGNLAGLEHLSLRVTGPIPPELWGLVRLKVLRLSLLASRLIPPELWSLASLEELDLGGVSGPIPSELGDLASLRVLGLRQNELTGSIPPELGSLTNLERLDLAQNELTGSIPPELGDLVNLTSLSLGSNALTGSIPPWLGNLVRLEFLNLNAIGLTGSIPPELGNLANLKSLFLPGNSLEGPIPQELGNLAKLEFLHLANNLLTGSIPPQLGGLANLTRLALFNNGLTGPIPPELGDLANLTRLELDYNDLTGPVPPELGDLANLTRLYLNHNRLTDRLPETLLGLSLSVFYWYENVGLCAPDTSAFRTWLAAISSHQPGPFCSGASGSRIMSLDPRGVESSGVMPGPRQLRGSLWEDLERSGPRRRLGRGITGSGQPARPGPTSELRPPESRGTSSEKGNPRGEDS